MRKLLLLVPLLGCSLLDQVRATTERPTLSFKEARLPHVDFQGAELDLIFLVTNPNPVGLDLTRASYKLEVEGHPVDGGAPGPSAQDRERQRLSAASRRHPGDRGHRGRARRPH